MALPEDAARPLEGVRLPRPHGVGQRADARVGAARAGRDRVRARVRVGVRARVGVRVRVGLARPAAWPAAVRGKLQAWACSEY